MPGKKDDINPSSTDPEVPEIGLPAHPGFIEFPAGVNSAAEKIAFLYRLQELLRLQHNEKGKLLREKQISQQEWAEFLRSWSEKSEKVVSEILAARAALKADDSWTIDLNEVFGL